ncbi:MAG: dTDP-4-amino-4,6-dideoxygalactose transaminase [Oscillospiraceae bacterium]|jgi:dTDP-4-amino-4,6-dideoxygalactose transaminase|nr:dTDP-4-amino-4,6-dideoxygalactose transaminase [Oscillospiraceae bacterium]
MKQVHKMIHFNIPAYVGTELDYMKTAIQNNKICGNGNFTKRCNQWLENHTKTQKSILTTSCTHSLELASILCEIRAGDEVIMPSYTFVSTANAFVLRGAKIVFVDIRPDTMNINEQLIESAITHRTKAIVPVHYAGVSCEMDKIMQIAKKYNLYVIEDAAQAIMSTYKDKALGIFGDFGCLSFHETKNYSMGEGGSLLINNDRFIERAEIISEKGTNRNLFLRGQVDKYTWVDIGSSYIPSELNAAYLWGQLENAEKINQNRLESWNLYHEELHELSEKGMIERPTVPKNCSHNAHMYYIKVRDINQRTELIAYLKQNGISSVFHYVPLHSAPAGLRFGEFHGEDRFTTKESERLLRLPMYFGLQKDEIHYIVNKINHFFT